MTDSQRLSVQLSEARSTLNECIEKRNKLPEGTDPAAADVQAMDDASKQVRELEVRYRAAVTKEGGETDEKPEAEQRTVDGEERERRRLLADSSVVPFLRQAVEGVKVEGREAELRKAILGDEADETFMPIDLLLPTREVRVDAVSAVAASAEGANQQPILSRVFTRSIAARLGVAMPSVAVGDAVYPVMTAGTTAAMVADGSGHDAAAAAVSGFNLEPIRITGAYLYNERQTLQLRGFEDLLRRDLSAVLADQMDNQVVNGDGNAPNVNGFLNELPDPTDPTAIETYLTHVSRFAGLVDGINSYMLSDIRAVVSKGALANMYSLYRGNTSDYPVADFLSERLGGLTVSSRLPETAGGGNAAAQEKRRPGIAALTAYPGRNAVMPVWRGVRFIADPYTKASEGQVRLTALAFFNFKILREAGWSKLTFQVAAP